MTQPKNTDVLLSHLNLMAGAENKLSLLPEPSGITGHNKKLLEICAALSDLDVAELRVNYQGDPKVMPKSLAWKWRTKSGVTHNFSTIFENQRHAIVRSMRALEHAPGSVNLFSGEGRLTLIVEREVMVVSPHHAPLHPRCWRIA